MLRSILLRSAVIIPLLLVARTSSVSFESSGIAYANGNCTGLLSPHDFDGANDTADQGYGAFASISVQSAACCTQNSTNPNHISAWALIAGNDNCGNGNDELAQAGYRKTQGVAYWLQFAEYDDCYGNYDEQSFGSSLSNGTYTDYQVYYDNVNSVETMNIGGGTYKLSTNFNPYGD